MALPPGTFRWYQPTFLFPLVVILLVGLFPFDPKVLRYAVPIPMAGWRTAFATRNPSRSGNSCPKWAAILRSPNRKSPRSTSGPPAERVRLACTRIDRKRFAVVQATPTESSVRQVST